ncbi:MAG: hypothetical protein ABSE89_07290 [Sedimentisphaerales bacterium]
MKAVLDDEIFFDEKSFELEIKSSQRGIIQRSATGLDGQVGIDLGLRGRKVIQKGELRSQSQDGLRRQIDTINGLIDGNLHTLECPDGRFFRNLLIEEFKTGPLVSGGAHISCQYNIAYTQQVY